MISSNKKSLQGLYTSMMRQV